MNVCKATAADVLACMQRNSECQIRVGTFAGDDNAAWFDREAQAAGLSTVAYFKQLIRSGYIFKYKGFGPRTVLALCYVLGITLPKHLDQQHDSNGYYRARKELRDKPWLFKRWRWWCIPRLVHHLADPVGLPRLIPLKQYPDPKTKVLARFARYIRQDRSP